MFTVNSLICTLILLITVSLILKMDKEASQQTDIAVGVLALQEKNDHIRYNIKIMEVRTVSEIEILDGIIFPGGETTAMSIIMEKNNQELLKALQNFVKEKPVFGTCAGLIMLANTIKGQMEVGQLKIGGINVTVRRNAYGRQLQSFEAPITIEDSKFLDSQTQTTPMVFIRAPGIESVDNGEVEILATYKDVPVAVRQNNLIGTSFHPELTDSLGWHMYFIDILIKAKENQI